MKKDVSLREKVKASIDNVDNNTLEVIHRIIEACEPDPFRDMNDEDLLTLKKSIRQADKGELIPHEEVQKRYKKWLTK